MFNLNSIKIFFPLPYLLLSDIYQKYLLQNNIWKCASLNYL